jgi:SAM-dependent methyltransferase
MKNQHLWRPSKFVVKKGRLVGSRNPKEIGLSSRLFADIVADLYATHLPDHCTGHLLDLGCGKVPLYGTYKDCITNATCVDWGSTPHKSNYLDYEFDLTQPLPLPDNQFDTILLSDVLEHIPNPEALWKEITRLLKPGGKFLMDVPFYYQIHEAPYDYYRYTEFALRRFAAVSSMKIILLQPIGGVPEIVADLVAKNVKKLPLMGKYLCIGMQYGCQHFVKTWLGAKCSQKTAKKFPLGYFLVAQKSAEPDPT